MNDAVQVRVRRTGRTRLLSVLVTLTGLLVFASSATAARDPLVPGLTDMHMKKGFVRKLGNNGIGVVGVGNGSVSSRRLRVPSRGGKLDPTDGQGFVENGSGFKFQLGKRGVPVTKATVNTVKLAVYATVAKAHMQFGTIVGFSTARDGFGADIKAIKLALTAKAARRISNRLGLRGGHRLEGGRVMSNLWSATQPATVTVLPQGSATLEGDVATLTKFAQKGVKLPEGISAIAPATKPTATSFQFPIVGGTLAPDASNGTVQTAGGVQILKEAEPISPTMKLLNIYADFETKAATVEIEITPTPPFPGAVGRSSIADLALEGATVVADPNARTIAVTGAEARIQAVAAATLNDVFNQPPPEPPPASNFIVGDSLGKFSLVAQAQ
jgi:hypothetical protein